MRKKVKHFLAVIYYKLFYAFSTLALFLNGKLRKSRKILEGVKDIHKGKRCFIIGNGPSLTAEDLDLLQNEITFASNKIYNIFPQTEWRPTYYAIFDENVARLDGVCENANSFNCQLKFYRSQGYGIYRKFKDACFVHSWYSRKYLDNPAFSDDISKGIYSIATVTYTLIQIARYMGCDEIYLLGMDNRYAYSRLRSGEIVRNEGAISYFNQNNEKLPSKIIPAATWEMDVAYEYAEKYSKENGFRIYNATRGGFLEAFERVDFDSKVKGK